MKLEHYAKRLATKTGTPVLEKVILRKRPVTALPAKCMPWTGRKTIREARIRVKMERDHFGRPYKMAVPEQPYGLITVEGKRLLVHRYILMLINRPNYEFTMRNECGNTLCCNPMHWTIVIPRHSGLPSATEEVPHYDAFLAALHADWSQEDVNTRLDQALASYSLTNWEELITSALLLDCPHDMLKVALRAFRKPHLLPTSLPAD